MGFKKVYNLEIVFKDVGLAGMPTEAKHANQQEIENEHPSAYC